MAKGMRSGRRRRIRELLHVLDDPNQIWRPVHTNMLVDLAMNQGNGEREAFTTEISQRIHAERRALVRDRKKHFQEDLEATLPKLSKALEVLAGYGFEKAMIEVEDEDGNKHRQLDPTKISDKDAKVALAAITLSLKSLGLLTTKVTVENPDASVFDAEGVEE